jgi:casein kinase 1/casein kinase 1 epsilon
MATDQKLAKRFIITKKIGAGAFGEIFQGIDIATKDEVAIKIEPSATRQPHLLYEAKLYYYFHRDPNAWENGIPKIVNYVQGNDSNMLAIELLGPSLEDMFSFHERKFSVKTTLMIAEQMLNRIEYLHKSRFLHRDLKPDNFAIGRGKNMRKIYVFDFGLCKKYISREGVHIPFCEDKSLTGTARYASLNTHRGKEQSRRDDIESFAYILIYFLRGYLPWQNMKAVNKKEKFERIHEIKASTTTEKLCQSCPPEFGEILDYARKLEFTEQPNYDLIRRILRRIWERSQFTNDLIFDWTQTSALTQPKPVTKDNPIPPSSPDSKERQGQQSSAALLEPDEKVLSA